MTRSGKMGFSNREGGIAADELRGERASDVDFCKKFTVAILTIEPRHQSFGTEAHDETSHSTGR